MARSRALVAASLTSSPQLSEARRVAEFGCAECGARFTRKYDRDRHVRTLHGGGGEVFSCAFCSSSVRRLDNLYSHVKRRHGPAALRQLRGGAGPGARQGEGLNWPEGTPQPRSHLSPLPP